jgi:hypothetical protein
VRTGGTFRFHSQQKLVKVCGLPKCGSGTRDIWRDKTVFGGSPAVHAPHRPGASRRRNWSAWRSERDAQTATTSSKAQKISQQRGFVGRVLSALDRAFCQTRA